MNEQLTAGNQSLKQDQTNGWYKQRIGAGSCKSQDMMRVYACVWGSGREVKFRQHLKRVGTNRMKGCN